MERETKSTHGNTQYQKDASSPQIGLWIDWIQLKSQQGVYRAPGMDVKYAR